MDAGVLFADAEECYITVLASIGFGTTSQIVTTADVLTVRKELTRKLNRPYRRDEIVGVNDLMTFKGVSTT